MSSIQLDHQNTSFITKKFPIYLICDQLTGAANIGAIFRLADAFGVEKIYFLGPEFEINRRTEKTSRSTHKSIPYEFIDKIDQVPLINFPEKNCIALEITSSSLPIQKLTITPQWPTFLLVGNENYGVRKEYLDLVDHCYHIPMFGRNSSMNIAQATGIALYEITNQYNITLNS